ncbi:hypothetical protein FQA39_LY08259 [Lamprigera yunnana]|nr:hypothetical protein FQA39_LY08259 [Lamprigera yunnana]
MSERFTTLRRLAEVGIHSVESGVKLVRYDPNVEEEILTAFEADPTTSIRVVGSSKSKYFTMESMEYNAPTCMQSLEEQDPPTEGFNSAISEEIVILQQDGCPVHWTLGKIIEDSDFEIDKTLQSKDDGWESSSKEEDNVSMQE